MLFGAVTVVIRAALRYVRAVRATPKTIWISGSRDGSSLALELRSTSLVVLANVFMSQVGYEMD